MPVPLGAGIKPLIKGQKLPGVHGQIKPLITVNVVYITQIASLVQMLKSGDVVFVVSVNRFWSVSQFFQFGKFCMANGVSLHLLAQPYLDLGNGKHWKPSVVSQMMRMVEVERYAIANMAKAILETAKQYMGTKTTVLQIKADEELGRI